MKKVPGKYFWLLMTMTGALMFGAPALVSASEGTASTDTEDSATVSIPSKSLSVSYLTLTDYDAAFWKICTIGLIPGFFLVVGLVVWMKRRKA